MAPGNPEVPMSPPSPFLPRSPLGPRLPCRGQSQHQNAMTSQKGLKLVLCLMHPRGSRGTARPKWRHLSRHGRRGGADGRGSHTFGVISFVPIRHASLFKCRKVFVGVLKQLLFEARPDAVLLVGCGLRIQVCTCKAQVKVPPEAVLLSAPGTFCPRRPCPGAPRGPAMPGNPSSPYRQGGEAQQKHLTTLRRFRVNLLMPALPCITTHTGTAVVRLQYNIYRSTLQTCGKIIINILDSYLFLKLQQLHYSYLADTYPL